MTNPPSTSPAQPPVARGPEARREPNSWRDIDPASFHVMIADDQAHLRAIVGNVFRKEGYAVTLVEDGEELLEQARANPPDLIVLDVMMPRLDGLAALERLREDPVLCRAYVLILSGQTSLEEKLRGFERGADDYLTKPYSIDELRARVRSGIRLRAVERHLEQSQRTVVRQEKLATIGTLASGIAHEFNNIMSGIAGFAQLAQRNPQFQERLVSIALEQARRAEKITSALSTFASTASPRFERADLAPLVESALTLVRKSVEGKGGRLSVSLPDSIPRLDVNFGQVQQLLLHLLLNAHEAIAEQGHVALRCTLEENAVRIEVDDDGPGIDPGNAARIFDPFFTTKGALGQSDGVGTGLGLTFALNVAVAHQGSLELAESRLGGACFRLRLPLPTVVASLPKVEPAVPIVEVPAPDDLHLVMVEDDLTLQEVVRELLDSAEVRCFASGPNALEHCRAERVDAVLLDVHLHGPWDGWKVLEELGKLASPPPVVLTTGSIEVDRAELDYPHVELLRKPFRLGELEDALRRLASADRDGAAAPTA